MKQFKQIDKSSAAPAKTPMAEKVIDFDAVEKMRVAIYPNINSETPPVCEVDFHFKTPQKDWDNTMTLKLRNNLYKINNIAYKNPAGFQYFDPFYTKAVQVARAFKKRHGVDLHNKLGKKYPDRYYTIPGLFVSYDDKLKCGEFQITEAEIQADDSVDVLKNYQCIPFELDQEGKNVLFGWIE